MVIHDGDGVLVRLANISGGEISATGSCAVTSLNGHNMVRFAPVMNDRDVAIHARVPHELAAQIAALVSGYATIHA